MDRQKLGEVIGAGFAGNEELRAENWLPIFDNEELLVEVQQRIAQGKLAAEEAAVIAVWGVSQVASGTLAPETTTVPEIDAETTERLESLSPNYRERVITRYNEKYTAVDGYIRDGKLPEAYRLPELGTFVDRIAAVAPAYETINKNGQAEFDFVPQGLTIEQWSGLLTGHKLPNGDTTTGAYRYHNISKVTDPTNPRSTDTSPWDVAVMDVAKEPAVRGISADGSKAARGYNLKKSLKTLREAHSSIGLPVIDASKSNLSADELLIKQLSPSEDMKFAIQLGRLERGEQPVDSNGIWTIGKENVKGDVALYSVFSRFDSSGRKAYSYNGGRGGAYGAGVVRLSARGKDFSPQS